MRVLLGVGGTQEGWTALEETLTRAAEAGDELTVAVYEREIEREVRERIDESEVDAAVRRISGHPGGGLVELADGEDFDRLVVAGGSRSTLGKIQLGSVAEFVVLNAETPVTLIR